MASAETATRRRSSFYFKSVLFPVSKRLWVTLQLEALREEDISLFNAVHNASLAITFEEFSLGTCV